MGQGQQGEQGEQGREGREGKGIKSMSYNKTDGIVTVTYTDDIVSTLGPIKGEKGDVGNIANNESLKSSLESKTLWCGDDNICKIPNTSKGIKPMFTIYDQASFKPTTFTKGSFNIGFSYPPQYEWSDTIVLDTSPGSQNDNQNVIAIKKLGGIGMRIYQDYSTAGNYSNYADVIMKEKDGTIKSNLNLNSNNNIQVGNWKIAQNPSGALEIINGSTKYIYGNNGKTTYL